MGSEDEDDDDEMDDGESGEDDESEGDDNDAEIASLREQIATAPSADAYLKLITLLKAEGELDGVRDAREGLAALVCPLDDSAWLEWIDDEARLLPVLTQPKFGPLVRSRQERQTQTLCIESKKERCNGRLQNHQLKLRERERLCC